MFLTIRWLKKVYGLYLQNQRFFLLDKEIAFSPRLFLGTLLRVYDWPIWEKIVRDYFKDLTEEEKALCEKGFDSLYAQDLFSLEFSKWYQEMLLGRPYETAQYQTLAYDFLCLKEQLRKQIQIPLLDKIKRLCLDLEELLEKGERPEEDYIKRLERLYSFFRWVEAFKPSPSEDFVKRGEGVLKKLKKLPLSHSVGELEELRLNLEKIFWKELQNFIEGSKI